MSPALLLLCGATVCLLLLLLFALRDFRGERKLAGDAKTIEDLGCHHVAYFPQMRQAMALEDQAFLEARGSRRLVRRVRQERRRIALSYLACLHADFLKLWQMARVVAALSPQVAAAKELARFRLSLGFGVRYELLRFRFLFGFSPFIDLTSVTEIIGKLAVRLETAMNELGDRAALAGEMTSALHRRGLDAP